jgi:hypothetical protein
MQLEFGCLIDRQLRRLRAFENPPGLNAGPGNLGGNAQRTRHIFNKAFLEALAKDFREGGPQAVAKVRKYQPAAYMKICALLVPREMKVEHSGGVKAMSDEQIEAAKVIEGTAEPTALPAPNRQSPEAALEVGPSERKPRKGRVPSPVGT